MDDFRFWCHTILTDTIQREKCAAVDFRPPRTTQFIQSVNVAFAYSTAMLNVMSGACGPFVYKGDKFCLRAANGIIFEVIVQTKFLGNRKFELNESE